MQMPEHVVGARHGLHPDARLPVEAGDRIVQRRRERSLHRDARQVVQQVHRDALASGQCVVRREHDHDPLAEHLDDLEPVLI